MSTYLDAQFGFGEESTYGTRVASTRFLEFLSETLQFNKVYIQSKAYRAGRKTPVRRRPSIQSVTGDITQELSPQGLGLLLKHVFGTFATVGSGPYTHTFTPGPINGKSLSIQMGRTDAGGTTRPFDYSGCKITALELDAKVGEIATIKTSFYGVNEDTTQSLITATYPTGILPFVFSDATLTVGGTSTPVNEVNLKIDNGLKVDRQRLGSPAPAQSLEPQEAAVRAITGTLDADFTDLTAYNRFKNQTQATLVLTFTSGIFILVITLSVEFDGKTPNAAGVGTEPNQSLPFTSVNATNDATVITAALTNSDATP